MHLIPLVLNVDVIWESVACPLIQTNLAKPLCLQSLYTCGPPCLVIPFIKYSQYTHVTVVSGISDDPTINVPFKL